MNTEALKMDIYSLQKYISPVDYRRVIEAPESTYEVISIEDDGTARRIHWTSNVDFEGRKVKICSVKTMKDVPDYFLIYYLS